MAARRDQPRRVQLVVTIGDGGPGCVAAGDVGDRRQREPVEMGPHHLAGLLPDRQQHALTLVVTGPVGMRLAEITERDRTIDGGHDLGQQDLVGRTRQHVSAAHSAFGSDESGALEGEQNLFEVRLRERCSLGDVANRSRSCFVVAERERKERSTRIIASGRHSHAAQRRASTEYRQHLVAEPIGRFAWPGALAGGGLVHA